MSTTSNEDHKEPSADEPIYIGNTGEGDENADFDALGEVEPAQRHRNSLAKLQAP